ncbi:MAG: hypothetical protein WC357_06290 [Candidatus Omnitrophota bacterium]|jgi:hypothetical protein
MFNSKKQKVEQKLRLAKKHMIKSSLAFKILNRNNFICQYCGKDGLGSLVPWRKESGPSDPFKAKGNPATSCSLCAVMTNKKVFSIVEEAGKDIGKKWDQLYQEYMRFLMKRREQIYKDYFRSCGL